MNKWYKKYIEEKFTNYDTALKLQAKEYERRLEALNGEAERLRVMQASYVPREVFEASVKAVLDKQEDLVNKTITPMKEWQDKMTGNIAGRIAVISSVMAVVIILAQFLIKIFVK